MALLKGTKVNVVICPHCKDGIYSVARHDFHYCSCGHTFVDGGFDYTRCGSTSDVGRIRCVPLVVPVSLKEMIDDYISDSYFRKHGTLGWNEIKSLYRQQLKKNIRMVATKSSSKKASASR